MKNKLFQLLIFCFITVNHIAYSAPPEVSTTIHSSKESYTLEKILGQGAFGMVFKALNTSGSQYAIKAYHINHSSEWQPHIYNDMQREYERGQLLEHANIVRSIDLFLDKACPSCDHTAFLVLQLVKGQTLGNTPANSLSKSESITSALHFIDAVGYALSKGVLHLDLHDGNVMIAAKKDVKIIDLASFYSWQEVSDYVLSHPLTGNRQAAYGTAHPQIRKDRKLDNFLNKHPELLNQLQLDARKIANHPLNRANFSRRAADQNAPSKKGIKKNDNQANNPLDQMSLEKGLFFSNYFNDIINISKNIVNKSKASKKERKQLIKQLEQVGKNYEEDYRQGIKAPFSFYLKQMSEILLLHKK